MNYLIVEAWTQGACCLKQCDYVQSVDNDRRETVIVNAMSLVLPTNAVLVACDVGAGPEKGGGSETKFGREEISMRWLQPRQPFESSEVPSGGR